MARFTSGWIKAWRKAAESDLVDNMVVWGLWHWLLYAATWQPQKKIIDGKQRILPAGTVLFSPKEVSALWGCSESVIRKWLNYLHDTGRVVRESCGRGTLVTICNWDTYQGAQDQACADREDAVRAPYVQRADDECLNEEGKKERKKETIQGSPLVAERKSLEDQREVIEACYAAWLETLAFYKAARPQLSPAEQLKIVQAVQRQGSAKAVLYALRGARYEPKGETFDPAQFLKISRVLDVESFDRFMNLGIRAEHKKAAE